MGEIGRDFHAQPVLEGERVVRVPHVLRTPVACGDQYHEFHDAAAQRAAETDVLAYLLGMTCKLGTAYGDAARRSEMASGTIADLVKSLALRIAHVLFGYRFETHVISLCFII